MVYYIVQVSLDLAVTGSAQTGGPEGRPYKRSDAPSRFSRGGPPWPPVGCYRISAASHFRSNHFVSSSTGETVNAAAPIMIQSCHVSGNVPNVLSNSGT
jgi:hypothetical protein